MIRFGPAGNSESFRTEGYKSSVQVPEYLSKKGLNAFEYQCGRGVNIGAEKAAELGREAAKYGIALSIHAPYYISLSSIDEEKRLNSINYILQSCAAARAMGADRIVFHSGSAGKMERSAALELACDTLQKVMLAVDENGYSDIILCPETMGKMNQLGSLEEVMTLCGVDARLIPCIDFGHLNARTQGGLKTRADFAHVLDTMEKNVGHERTRVFHSHFSKIQYSKGGEVRHLTFADTIYGPEFEPLAELVAEREYAPRFICESDGLQAEDSVEMMRIYGEKAAKGADR